MITNRIANDNVELIISDYAYELPIDNVQTFIRSEEHTSELQSQD